MKYIKSIFIFTFIVIAFVCFRVEPVSANVFTNVADHYSGMTNLEASNYCSQLGGFLPTAESLINYCVSDTGGLGFTSDTGVGPNYYLTSTVFASSSSHVIVWPQYGRDYPCSFYYSFETYPAIDWVYDTANNGLFICEYALCTDPQAFNYNEYGACTYDFDDTSTHIMDLVPGDKVWFPYASSTAMSFQYDYYIAQEDLDKIGNIRVSLHNIDQNVPILNFFSPSDIMLLNYNPETAGAWRYSTTTVVLAPGNYRIKASIDGIFFNYDELSHQFCIQDGTQTDTCGTFLGNISQDIFTSVNGLYASSTATSTGGLIDSCNPISSNISTAFLNTDFSVISCLAFLFRPDTDLMVSTFDNFVENASTHFPLGYVSDFISILNSTTTSSLPVISAVIPQGVVGAGSEINLDLANSLDFILNATTSQFVNESASSTKTFYEITSYYWEIFVYLALILYLLKRILGDHVLGGIIGGEMSEIKNMSLVNKQYGVDVYKSYLKNKK